MPKPANKTKLQKFVSKIQEVARKLKGDDPKLKHKDAIKKASVYLKEQGFFSK